MNYELAEYAGTVAVACRGTCDSINAIRFGEVSFARVGLRGGGVRLAAFLPGNHLETLIDVREGIVEAVLYTPYTYDVMHALNQMRGIAFTGDLRGLHQRLRRELMAEGELTSDVARSLCAEGVAWDDAWGVVRLSEHLKVYHGMPLKEASRTALGVYGIHPASATLPAVMRMP